MAGDKVAINYVYTEEKPHLKELKKIAQCPQRQDAVEYQLVDLITIANKFGMYDAADIIKNMFTQ